MRRVNRRVKVASAVFNGREEWEQGDDVAAAPMYPLLLPKETSAAQDVGELKEMLWFSVGPFSDI